MTKACVLSRLCGCSSSSTLHLFSKFYDLFLRELTEHPLNESLKKILERISYLTPGDFKVVRDRYLFHPQEEITHQLLMEELEAEASLKNIHDNKKPIGF